MDGNQPCSAEHQPVQNSLCTGIVACYFNRCGEQSQRQCPQEQLFKAEAEAKRSFSSLREGPEILLCGPVSYCMALYHTVWPCIIQSGPVSYCMALYHTVWPCIIQSGPVSYCMALCHTVWPCIVQSGPVSYCMALCHTVSVSYTHLTLPTNVQV